MYPRTTSGCTTSELRFQLGRLGEERLGGLHDRGECVGARAVAGDDEKAEGTARFADLLGDGIEAGRVIERVSDVDHRHVLGQ